MLRGCYWLRRTVLEFVSARYAALVPVAVITLTTSWHGVRCLMCAVHGDVTLSPWAEIPRSNYCLPVDYGSGSTWLGWCRRRLTAVALTNQGTRSSGV